MQTTNLLLSSSENLLTESFEHKISPFEHTLPKYNILLCQLANGCKYQDKKSLIPQLEIKGLNYRCLVEVMVFFCGGISVKE